MGCACFRTSCSESCGHAFSAPFQSNNVDHHHPRLLANFPKGRMNVERACSTGTAPVSNLPMTSWRHSNPRAISFNFFKSPPSSSILGRRSFAARFHAYVFRSQCTQPSSKSRCPVSGEHGSGYRQAPGGRWLVSRILSPTVTA
jgi:hypothetical protein